MAAFILPAVEAGIQVTEAIVAAKEEKKVAQQNGDTVHDALAVKSHVSTLPENKWRGVYQLKREPFESYRAAFVRSWNDQVEKFPATGFSKIKR